VIEWSVRYLEDSGLIKQAVDKHENFGDAIRNAEVDGSDYMKDDGRKSALFAII
jgi:hypothetical protein